MNLAIDLPLEDLRNVGRKHGLLRLSLFGSVLREDFDQSRSDVDVLVRLPPSSVRRYSYMDLARLAVDLEDVCGREVDVSVEDMLRPGYRESILAEVETVYDAE